MRDLSSLKHISRKAATGANIIVLDTGAVISAEDTAMLQALHSRSSRGVLGHLAALSAGKDSGSFMDQYYVGYGDKSIGDCGTTTIFIEGVSMLVAKAIQDWSLYCGQESSTRYIPFDNQPFLNPYQTEIGTAIQERWRAHYVNSLPIIIDDLIRRYPQQEGEDEKAYEKAIKARAFDNARGFLPAGATTNLSWHTNLRQAADHLMRLRHHPLFEVRMVAEAIEDALKEAHPHSFGQKRYSGTEEFNRQWMNSNYYFETTSFPDFEAHIRMAPNLEEDFAYSFQHRPAKAEVPRELGACGIIDFSFLLDFASFRDVQRHRAVYQRMPLLEARHGFGEWYLSELPEQLREESQKLLAEQTFDVVGLEGAYSSNTNLDQYYIPMGFNVPCVVSGDLPSIIWLVELRATRFVHPTLRRRAQQMAEFLERELGPQGLKLHLDSDPNRFDVKRGAHDIVAKV